MYVIRWLPLHLDNSTAKACLHNQGCIVFPFHSRLACCILNLSDNHGIALIPAYIHTHLNVEADFSITGKLGSGMASSSSHS